MHNKIYTYKTVSLESGIIQSEWQIYGRPIPASHEIKSWKKNADLQINCNLYVSAKELDFFISENAEASFYIVWNSLSGRNGTSLQGCAFVQKYENKRNESVKEYNFSCNIPGDKIAGDTEISLVLAISSEDKFVKKSEFATEKGAVIFKTSEILYLEGGQALFPVKAIYFKERSGIARNALYYLRKKYIDLDSNFNAAYTLFFNIEHPLFKKINSDLENDVAANYLLKMIMFDVYRTIIFDALDKKHGLDELSESFEENAFTLRAVYSKILNEVKDRYFPEKDLASLKEMINQGEEQRNSLYTAIQEYVFGDE